ncbi:MAG: hypothetical protein COA58_10610 [Bacteroidetes bacterium]|nr:MAG: hypothetical protein COA58_10610 [Bacteroidota bacterium]
MILNDNRITYKGKPMFYHAEFKTPLRACAKMEELACFVYMIDGTYEAFASYGGFKVGANEALIKKCGNYIANLQGSFESVTIYFYPDVLHEMYKHEVPSFLSVTEEDITMPKKVIANELLDKFINNLFIYFDNPELMDDELALLKLKELILILLKSEQGGSIHKFLSELFSPDKLQFTTIIQNNIFNNMSIEELAFICNKSLSSLKREFKKVYDDTPAHYIKNKRLEYAEQLLSSTSNSISDIAFDVGFQDVTTFSASFRVRFKDSPTNYRLNQSRK